VKPGQVESGYVPADSPAGDQLFRLIINRLFCVSEWAVFIYRGRSLVVEKPISIQA
jgi:hypothetical protein